MKKLIILSLLIFSAWGQIKVTTTIFPLYSVVKEVGGTHVHLTNLVPWGVEAHDYDPTPKEMTKLLQSDLFFMSSSIMEPWGKKIVNSLKIEGKTVDMSQKVALIPSKEGHKHGTFDPHYWLSIRNYLIMINEVKNYLSQKDPSNAAAYKRNAESYTQKVKQLQTEYEALKICKNKKMVVNHDAFSYFSYDYGITQYAIAGISPDSKPSAKQMAELTKIIKSSGVTTVFFEEFASDKVAKTLAHEAGVKSDVLSPLENITTAQGNARMSYIEVMRENLTKLKVAMECR